jgi:murein DD-endopeptidase MepM/ murein hydrolase activator NlpD
VEEGSPAERGDAWWTRRAVVGSAVVAVALLAAGGYAAGVSQRDGEADDRVETSRSEATSTTSSSTTAPSTTAAPSTTSPSTTTPTTTAPSTTVVAAVRTGAYSFPIDPADGASYARSHHDYPAADIFAPCGVDVVAPQGGTVQEVTTVDNWTYAVNSPETRGGLSFSIVGDDGVRYYGSHLGELDIAVRPGSRLVTGQRLGTVGESGNAKGTGCHLHFGISTPCGPGDVLRRRGEFWPQEYLDAWRIDQPLSPAALVAAATC